MGGHGSAKDVEEEHRCVAESGCAKWGNVMSHDRVCVESTALTIQYFNIRI